MSNLPPGVTPKMIDALTEDREPCPWPGCEGHVDGEGFCDECNRHCDEEEE